MWDIVLATSNSGKIKEFNEFSKMIPNVRFIPQEELGVSPIEETGLTFYENAIAKARHASQETGKPAIADDSGLCVPALGGAPGIISARYARVGASDTENVNHLLSELDAFEEEDRYACFHSVIAFLTHFEYPFPNVFDGVWEGEILTAPQGKKGFGYDPVFYVPTHECSAAELDLGLKNEISHRGQAMQDFLLFMKEVME
jgi:XTP/dITP diphosphohydrolase